MNADLFAGRYELLHEAPPGAAGRLFEARDVQTGEIVALKVFRRELPSDAAERADLERVVAAAKACSHPGIIRFHDLVIQDGYLTREWIHGFPLIDLLRRRRELPGQEVVTLLNDVPDTIDTAVTSGLAPSGDLLSRLFVAWDRSVPADELVGLRGVPVTDWQSFTIKLSPINLSHVLPLCPEETMSTMIGPLSAKAGPAVSPAVGFAEMVYQLLGAPRRTDRSRRYVPLGTLNETGNGTLRRVIERVELPQNCAAFWKEFLSATGLSPQPRRAAAPVVPPPLPPAQAPTVPPPSSILPPPVVAAPAPTPAPAPVASPPPIAVPPPLPKRRSLKIPDKFMGNVQPGTILRLTPRDVSFTPIHLIARPAFRIGRSLYHADFVTRVLPEIEENEKLTKEIGRVHVLAELRNGQLTLRDGNGEQASVNGSSFEAVPLTHETPLPLTRRGVLMLYRNYELEVNPLLGSTDLGWQIDNEVTWAGPTSVPSPVSGGVVFQPGRNQPTLRQAAWLFTRLDFALTQRGEVSWCEAGASVAQAAFLYHRGQFWIATYALPPGMIQVDRTELPVDAAVPLISGQSVQLGGGNYMVEIQ